MVGKIYEIVDNYEKHLQEMPFIPRGLFRRRMLCQDGGPNRDFLTYLFCDSGLAMHFLKDVGLLRSKVQCNTCGQDMTWSAEPSIPEGFRWRCPRKVAGVKCSASRSIRTGSWFQQSRLTFREVLSLTTLCAANLPTVSWKNIASVQVPSLIGACSARKPCWFSWRAARKNSAEHVHRASYFCLRHVITRMGISCRLVYYYST